jgi:DNA-binding MarR family transcriptional regulator
MNQADDPRAQLRIQIEGYLNVVRIHRELEARATTLLEEAGIDGITLPQATALLVLVQEGAPITAARLAGLLNVSQVTVGRFVRSLEQNGWIRRRPDPADARAMLLVTTDKTMSTLGQFLGVTNRLMDDAYLGMSSGEVADMVASLARVRKNLYHASGKEDTRPQVLL